MEQMQSLMGHRFDSGTLPSTTPVVVTMFGAPLPCNVQLVSTAPGRLIEVSIDGVNYETPEYDTNTTALIRVALLASVSHVRITGVASDTWVVR